eukprot:CAMPEP_0203884674 /NCGR_PEP_ID=MMETSP0359-20131031/28700_1 /ASSEMBLY_ACC=CAM_ASM_000338 /TAXON_ID=268821 /ORGANISM="Scrippsiella Hangoei, Strain SHTV-5" /LENGTH=57 /DNA_ID=CAMNT_0050805181 /DNA_START=165 /DNA_END=338 /DNA_ORIENTATION=+
MGNCFTFLSADARRGDVAPQHFEAGDVQEQPAEVGPPCMCGRGGVCVCCDSAQANDW